MSNEQMDLVHDRANIVPEEDRLSNLSDDVIHHILSFLDMKHAVQTSILSRRWRHVWTSMSNLNLNSCSFRTLPLFSKFVKDVLSHRNHDVDVSSVNLTFKGLGATTPSVVKSVVNYAYSHRVSQMSMTWLTRKFHQFPQCVFRSNTLKHLTVATNSSSFCLHEDSIIPKIALDFPALETLVLSNMHFGDGGDENLSLFSKCVNLKELTLHKCCMYGLEIFNICAPKLSSLTISDVISFPNGFNVVAPKLKNLRASVRASVDRFPVLFDTLRLSTQGFNTLENVNLSLLMPHYEPERFVPVILNLFQTIRSAKFLILDLEILEILSLDVDQLSLEPCPLDNLRYVKINMEPLKQKDRLATIPTQVRNYLLENSPSATFIVDLPQVPPQKRSRQQVDNEIMATEVAKLKIGKMAQEKRDEVMVPQNAEIQMPEVDVCAAELPPSPRLSSSVMASSSNVAWLGGSNRII